MNRTIKEKDLRTPHFRVCIRRQGGSNLSSSVSRLGTTVFIVYFSLVVVTIYGVLHLGVINFPDMHSPSLIQ